MDQKIEVNGGYVRLVMVAGSDLSVVNAARASYAKESEEFSDKDAKLLKFLVKNKHMSPFRHAFMTFEVEAPLMVARQWYKYMVGSDHTMDGWNEASRRYITMEPRFYHPVWRTKPANSKQGSGEFIEDETTLNELDYMFQLVSEQNMEAYNRALEIGVAPEQARCFLPAYAMQTIWRWSASLQSIMHFLDQRLEDDAQWEIRCYAQAVRTLVEPHFPVTFEALVGGKPDGSS